MFIEISSFQLLNFGAGTGWVQLLMPPTYRDVTSPNIFTCLLVFLRFSYDLAFLQTNIVLNRSLYFVCYYIAWKKQMEGYLKFLLSYDLGPPLPAPAKQCKYLLGRDSNCCCISRPGRRRDKNKTITKKSGPSPLLYSPTWNSLSS